MSEIEDGAMRMRLPRDTRAPAAARAFVAEQLRNMGIKAPVIEKARLIASELVSNACRHGKGIVEVRIAFPDSFLRLEVIDEGSDQVPAVREQPADQSGGWGLQIVDRLATQWGVFEGTTHVWADLALQA